MQDHGTKEPRRSGTKSPRTGHAPDSEGRSTQSPGTTIRNQNQGLPEPARTPEPRNKDAPGFWNQGNKTTQDSGTKRPRARCRSWSSAVDQKSTMSICSKGQLKAFFSQGVPWTLRVKQRTRASCPWCNAWNGRIFQAFSLHTCLTGRELPSSTRQRCLLVPVLYGRLPFRCAVSPFSTPPLHIPLSFAAY